MTTYLDLLKNSLKKFMADKCLTWAAAISYYAILSVFPLILGVMAVASLIISDPQTRQDIIKGLSDAFPNASQAQINIADVVNGFIDSLSKAAPVLAAFSIISALWSGTGIFEQIMNAVNEAWDVRKDSRKFYIKISLRIIMLVFLGLLVTISFGFGLMMSLIKSLDLFGFSPGNLSFIFDTAAYLLPLAITTFIFVIIFWLSPNRVQSQSRQMMLWKPVFLGAFIAAVLFEAAQYGLSFYFTSLGGASGYARTYGAIAGIIIFLFFLYVAAAIMLLGAEIASEASRVKEAKLVSAKTGMALPETRQVPEAVPEEGHLQL